MVQKLFPYRLNREVQQKPPPPPTPPPKPIRATPTPSEWYYKDIQPTTTTPRVTYQEQKSQGSASFNNDDVPTVPNILKFYLTDATQYPKTFSSDDDDDRPYSNYQQGFTSFNSGRKEQEEHRQPPPPQQQQDYADEIAYDIGSPVVFYNDTEGFFPEFVSNTVSDFSSSAGEDGKHRSSHKLYD